MIPVNQAACDEGLACNSASSLRFSEFPLKSLLLCIGETLWIGITGLYDINIIEMSL